MEEQEVTPYQKQYLETLQTLPPSGGIPLFVYNGRPIWGGSPMTGIEVCDLIQQLNGDEPMKNIGPSTEQVTMIGENTEWMYICREGQPYAMLGCMCTHCMGKECNPNGNWTWLDREDRRDK